MTKRIFDADVMQRTCQATVTACMPYKKGYRILLDQTVFFPESGGQLSDTGVLKTADNDIRVLHASEKDGDVLHETDEPIPVGTPVEAVLDWEVRMDHMQQHCGEHLVSYGFWKLYGAAFVDAGNIWTIRDYESQPGGQFRFKNILRDMAVAYGLGVRLNFSYFFLRLDAGMKAVNPAYTTSREHYPVIHPRLSRDLTFHFAVGLPF